MSTPQACRTNRHRALRDVDHEQRKALARTTWLKYSQTRRGPKRSTKPNPLGRICLACRRVIVWRYQDGEPWETPMFYCPADPCQRVRAVRAKGQDLVHRDLLSNRGNGGRRDGTS